MVVYENHLTNDAELEIIHAAYHIMHMILLFLSTKTQDSFLES